MWRSFRSAWQVLFKDSVSYLKQLQKGDIKSKSI